MKRRLWFSLLLVVVVVWSGSAPVGAQTDTRPLDDRIAAAREEVEAASAEEARLLSQIQESGARKKELDGKVATLERQVATAQRDVSAAEARLAGLEDQQQQAEVRLAETTAALAAAKAELARHAIASYTGGTEAAKYIEVALRSRDMAELVSKRAYLKVVAGSQAEAVTLNERLRNQVADLREMLEASRAKAQAQRDVVAAQRAGLQSQRDAQSQAAGQVAAEISQETKLKDEALSRKDEFEAKADSLQAESDALAARLRARASAPVTSPTPNVAGGSGGPPSAARGPGAAPSGGGAAVAPRPGRGLANPLPGAPITSGFGYRIHPIYGTSRLHAGIDIGAGTGASIRAAGSGVVVSAGPMGGYGNATVIDHGGGLATLYAHQSSVGVSAGQQVSQGQVIGRVGCTGACTGPHLHFEVRVNGSPVDPMGYI